MLKLVWKDAVVASWFLLVGIPLYAMQLLGMASIRPLSFFVTVLFTGALAFGSIGLEEVQGTEALWCSLPVSRRDVVFARYTTTAIGVVGGLAMSWAVGQLASRSVFSDPELPSHGLGPGAHSVLFAVLMFCGAVYLPCLFRLGAGRGLMAFSVILLGVLVLLSAVGSLAVHLVGGIETLQGLREQDPARLEAARQWIDRWGRLVSAGLVVVSLVAFGASAVLSARFYSTRDC